VVARQLAGLGWTKATIKRFLWEHSRFTHAEVRETGMWQWIRQADDTPTVASADMELWPITRTPEQIILCVAGGYHPTHNYWMQAYAPKVAGRPITLPAAWDTLITEADAELSRHSNPNAS
jgi:hypothetical protein